FRSRAARSGDAPHTDRGSGRRLRFHRRLVQPDAPTFGTQLPLADRLRAAGGHGDRRVRTWPVEAAGPVDHAQIAWPTGPWKTLRVSHSSHRLFFLVMTKQTNRKRQPVHETGSAPP